MIFLNKLTDNLTIKIFQKDWIPGFAGLISYDEYESGDNAHVILNIGSLLQLVEELPDYNAGDVPYMICEFLMHEIAHALEQWAFVEFNEERVEAITEKYRQKYLVPKFENYDALRDMNT